MSPSSPFTTRRGFQSVGSSKPPPGGTRCTFVLDDGTICDAFPAWPIPGKRDQRRCEGHKGQEKSS